MIRAAPLMLLLLGLAACGTPDPAARLANGTCPLIRLAEMPVAVHNNLLFVLARIDNQPISMLVDTGAERTLLTEAAVERLHLPRDTSHATRTFGIGTPTAAYDAKLPNGIVLGGTRFPVEAITVGNFGMSKVANGTADGLLGADILLAFDIDLDLPAQQMTLYHARRECSNAPPPWQQPYTSLAGVATRRDRLVVPFELDGVSGMAVLDTGAQVSSISQQMIQRLGLADGDMSADRTVMARGAAPDQVAVHVHRFHEFRVGPALLRSPLLPVVPISGGMGDALVGADFLSGRRVWLSFSTHRVFMTPVEHGPWIAVTQTGS